MTCPATGGGSSIRSRKSSTLARAPPSSMSSGPTNALVDAFRRVAPRSSTPLLPSGPDRRAFERRGPRLPETELQHRPAPAEGEPAEPRVGIHHAWLAHPLQDGQVRDRVGVEVALRELDPFGRGEAFRPVGLPVTVADGEHGLAGEAAIAHHELRHEDVLDAEVGS